MTPERIAPFGVLDLDDARAHIGQHHARQGRRQYRAQLDDENIVQCVFHQGFPYQLYCLRIWRASVVRSTSVGPSVMR